MFCPNFEISANLATLVEAARHATISSAKNDLALNRE
jgi:hypothetical protein